jgi:hypothetical protein
VSEFDEIPDNFLWCRDVRHSWEPFDVRDYRNKVARRDEILQVLRCERCATKRIRVLGQDGGFLRSGGYDYPEGYLLKDHGPMTPADRGMIRKINIEKHRKPKRGRGAK